MDDRLLIVSSDSHAGIPKELWSEYLDPQFRELIPGLHDDNAIYAMAVQLPGARKEALAPLEEHREIHRTGWHGLHDPALRLAEMDREGVAAEFVFHGDSRLGDLFHNSTNRAYPLEAWEAGARAWNRWAADAFGFATDRFLLTAAVGPCVDLDAAVAEIHWIADHGFAATYAPHYMTHPGMPPLFDEYWEPYWTACEERGIAIVGHAGFGTEQGVVFRVIEDIYGAAAAAAGSTEAEQMLRHAGAVREESADFFTQWVNRNVESRRPLWQLTLGAVFDRHPGLRLMLTEIRVDWIPATLQFLDQVYDERPGRRAGEAEAERVLAHQLHGRRVVHPQGRGRDASRARGRDDSLRPRLPALREHVAPHPAMAAGRVSGRSRGRAPAHARRERHSLLRPRP